MSAQAGTIYRYLAVDADHDVSSDVLSLSLDDGTTWSSSGVTYINPDDYPAPVLDGDTAKSTADGFTRYWWRILTGPDGDWPLDRGQNLILGSLADNPEQPHFAWKINVGPYE